MIEKYHSEFQSELDSHIDYEQLEKNCPSNFHGNILLLLFWFIMVVTIIDEPVKSRLAKK